MLNIFVDGMPGLCHDMDEALKTLTQMTDAAVYSGSIMISLDNCGAKAVRSSVIGFVEKLPLFSALWRLS